MSNLFIDKLFKSQLEKHGIELVEFALSDSKKEPGIKCIFYKHKFFSKYCDGEPLYFYGAFEYRSEDQLPFVIERFIISLKSIPDFFNTCYKKTDYWISFVQHQVQHRYELKNIDSPIVYGGSKADAIYLTYNCICLAELMLEFDDPDLNKHIESWPDLGHGVYRFLVRKAYKYKKALKRLLKKN